MPISQIQLPTKLKIDDLYKLFLDPPSRPNNTALIIQYPLILNSLLFDEAKCHIDEQNNIHMQLANDSKLHSQLNNALQKIHQNELKEYTLPQENNKEFVFPAKFLQNSRNVATFMIELSNSQAEATLYHDVFQDTQKARQETKVGNVLAGMFMLSTAALAIATLVAAVALPVLVPAIIAPLCFIASGLSAAYIAHNNKAKAENIDKSSTTNFRDTLHEIVEYKQEMLQKKKLLATQSNKLMPEEQKKYFRNVAKKQKNSTGQARS